MRSFYRRAMRNRLRKNSPPFCHSERSEKSLLGFSPGKEREIPRFARNDELNYFFCSLQSQSLQKVKRAGQLFSLSRPFVYF
jgi:hypothetical protein